MKVLVTGTDGYIGSVMAPYLVKRGHEVVGLDTGFYRAGSLYDGYKGFKTQITKDTRQITLDDLRGFDACIDLAGLSNDALGQLNPEITYEINHHGSARLAKLCKEAGVSRFLYSSSCSVYGIASEPVVSEKSKPNPLTAYAKSKILVEQELMKLASDDFSPVMFRNSTAFGVSPRMRFDIVLNNFAGHAWTSKEIKLKSDGSPERPLVHILDISQAFACALDLPREALHNQIINIGDTNQNYRVRELAEVVGSVFPGCTVSFGKNDEDERSYRVSFDKISELLPAFKCTMNLEAGAKEFRKLFEEIDLSLADFEFPAYTRLNQLKQLLQTGKLDQSLYWRVQ
ncbi:MAG: NAD-dependent epimerase/dehydratase family protein [Anaerolineales bacterium]